jgi:uncharacterized protein (UPF0548 family)
MFLTRRPSSDEIEQFLNRCRELPLSYQPVGVAQRLPANFKIDEAQCALGNGIEVFERAKLALTQWRQFELGWVELFPRDASIEAGTVVAVVVNHLGFWSINGCRVVYALGQPGSDSKFGFAYGTLTNHAESGEEIFEVSIDAGSREVTYRIRAASKPRAALARIGYPFTRALQARFRRDSLAAMQRAVSSAPNLTGDSE